MKLKSDNNYLIVVMQRDSSSKKPEFKETDIFQSICVYFSIL
jgi:hypothetical protein